MNISKYYNFIKESSDVYVTCINNINDYGTRMNLTIGKIYKVYKNEVYYNLKNDLGDYCSYSRKFFTETEDYKKKREEMIIKNKDIDPYGEEDWIMD